MERLQRKIDELEKKMDAMEQSPEPEVRMDTPFTPSIMDAPLPKDVRLLAIKAYIGTSDSRTHITRYKASMVMIRVGDTIMYMAFLSTLDGVTQDWFNTISN